MTIETSSHGDLAVEAVGGETGAGLYVSSHEHKVDWIVIKAICDWADGNKSKNKTARQKKAAMNAAQFVVQAAAIRSVDASDVMLGPLHTRLPQSLRGDPRNGSRQAPPWLVGSGF